MMEGYKEIVEQVRNLSGDQRGTFVTWLIIELIRDLAYYAVIGILAWHVTPVLHRPHPVGRITMMVVAEGERRHGIGRALVDAACERMLAKGCGLIEVTSNVDLSGAHGFYRRLGFERTSYRFARKLEPKSG